MRDTDRGRCLIDMLSARTAGAVRIDPKIIVIDLHIQIFLDIRHDIAGHKRGLSLSRRIERRDTHQTVHTFF